MLRNLINFKNFFKEQHETSFSHVPNKNWMSFTAGKDGILTKILLFGKANYLISEHYGSAMRGFVRESNPNTGTVFGEWELSRDEIVNQLAAQGLAENEPGWITIRMRGEIPQEAGKTYFLVCKEIDDERPWFEHSLSAKVTIICQAGIGFIRNMTWSSVLMSVKPAIKLLTNKKLR